MVKQFAHPELPQICGEPAHAILLEAKQMLKTNAHQSVGNQANYGYLGLISTPREFTNISNTLLVCPTDQETL